MRSNEHESSFNSNITPGVTVFGNYLNKNAKHSTKPIYILPYFSHTKVALGDKSYEAFAKKVLDSLSRAVVKGTIEQHEVEKIINDEVDVLLTNAKTEFQNRYNDLIKTLKKHGLFDDGVQARHDINTQECFTGLDELKNVANEDFDAIVAIAKEELLRNRQVSGAIKNIRARSNELLLNGCVCGRSHRLSG